MNEVYDVYYSTGGAQLVGGGADVWVNNWIEEVAPHLDTKPILLIHRTKKGIEETPEQKKTFENSVKAGRGGNEGREVVKKIKKNYKEVLNTELEHLWQGDDPKKFRELLGGARRIHILHGYYAPHKFIVENKEKIHSNMIHVSVRDCLKASMVLDLDRSFHTLMEQAWEDEICKLATHPVWIGAEKSKLDYPTEHIPNYYEFKHNLDVSDSNQIGYAARMETRKCPHFLEGLDSILFTSIRHIKWWEQNANTDTSTWKKISFSYKFLDNFMKRDWGISHSAHIFEPFGYSIFQAVDYGKIPILAHDWIPKYDYPFRASSVKEFHEHYHTICKLSLQERRDYVFPLREYLKENYGDKKAWREKMLRIFND